jgi:hypothetical protein
VLRPSLAALSPPTSPLAKQLISLTGSDQVFYIPRLSSGAHELFGHVWLAMHGVPSGHNERLAGTQTIRDPFGEKFTGDVNTFVDEFVQDRTEPRDLRSKTEDLSDAALGAALNDFIQVASRPDGYDITPAGMPTTPRFKRAWQSLRRLYTVLLRNAPAEGKRLQDIVAKLTAMRDGMTGDPREAFDRFMFGNASVLGNMNPEAHVVKGLGIPDPRLKPKPPSR